MQRAYSFGGDHIYLRAICFFARGEMFFCFWRCLRGEGVFFFPESCEWFLILFLVNAG